MQMTNMNQMLTPEEIESLRKDLKEGVEQLRGRSKHLFEGLKGKADSSSINRLLTPSEIESLRKDKKEGLKQLKGRSKHLFEGRKGEADSSSTAKPGRMDSELASLQEEARQALKIMGEYCDKNPMPWRTPPKK
jgi:hypothetical protein